VLDVAAAGAALLPVPAQRLPLVSLGKVEVAEGDSPVPFTSSIPFRIVGTLTRRAQLAVLVVSLDPARAPETMTVELAPGQTRGRIPIDVLGNDVDDQERGFVVAAWASRGVMTDGYLGELWVLDDDPAPTVRVTTPRRTVAEGGMAVWTITLDQPVNYFLPVTAEIVRGPKNVRALNGKDVPRAWLDGTFPAPGSLSTPLYRRGISLFGSIEAGLQTMQFAVPIRRDGVREPREALTLRVSVGDVTVTRTVFVAASR
jgi:hypothetical protein